MKHILLLHGALGAASQFDALAALLPEYPTVHAIHLPGHGSNLPDKPFSLQMFSNAVLQYLNEQNIDSASIFGYSMGGYAALHLASANPDRVTGILTYGTKLDWTPEIAMRMTGMVNAEKIETKAPALAEYLNRLHADWKQLCSRTSDFMTALGNGVALQESDFQKIQCPVTIVRGEADTVVTEEESRHVASTIPNGNFISLPEGLHHYEKVSPEIFSKLILQFL